MLHYYTRHHQLRPDQYKNNKIISAPISSSHTKNKVVLTLRVLIWKKHRQIKLQHLERVRIWAFGFAGTSDQQAKQAKRRSLR